MLPFYTKLRILRAGWRGKQTKATNDFWITVQNNFIDISVLEWLKLFGDHNDRHHWKEGTLVCRNIKTLFNFEPPVTDEEIHAAALQFVRKVSGFNKPSKINEGAFLTAVDAVAAAAGTLLSSLETNAPPRSREEEAAKAHARAARRFAR